MSDKTRSSHWLPLICIVLLAGLTYWLLQLNLPAPKELPPAPKRHTSDYFADNFLITVLNPAGTSQYRINATKMVHYIDNDNTEVAQPALRAFTPGQPDVMGKAARGIINGDISIVDLYGSAHIWRAPSSGDPAMQAKSEHFRVWVNDDFVETEKPIELQRGDSRVKATGMIYNNTTRVMRLTSQVRGVIAASDASASDGP